MSRAERRIELVWAYLAKRWTLRHSVGNEWEALDYKIVCDYFGLSKDTLEQTVSVLRRSGRIDLIRDPLNRSHLMYRVVQQPAARPRLGTNPVTLTATVRS